MHIVPERTFMYQFNIKSFFYKIFTLCCFAICFFYAQDVFAMSIADYSYDKVYESLPATFQDKEFVYKSSDGVCLIEFANYNGNPYRTSVKKKKDSNEFLYCIDRNNSIEFTDEYQINNNLFNEELRTRLGIAFYYGPSVWKGKANSKFTTGNFITDYYMTQIVTHALIYKYGGQQANMGINFEKLTFKSGTDDLKKKTTAFYKFCCDAKIKYKNGYFQSVDFKFNPLQDSNMYLDGEQFTSSIITCNTDDDMADVTEFTRRTHRNFEDLVTIQAKTTKYNSDIQLCIPYNNVLTIHPGYYTIPIYEDIVFNRKQAALWYCTNISYIDTTQELGDLFGVKHQAEAQIEVSLLAGKLYLYKKDSVTNEEIQDAQFQVLQYNSATKQYEYYCDMTYNATDKRYESNNLFLSINNKDGKFQVVEKSPGNNYQLDWDGQYFEITPEKYLHEIHVENTPILGSLTIHKEGEQWSYKDKQFLKDKHLPLSGVKFELYAKNDIYLKDKVWYAANTKIADLITDNSGNAKVANLPMGNYYVKEVQTLDDYVLDSKITEFSIQRDGERKYSNVSLDFINHLKTTQVHIYKCYYNDTDTEQKDPIALKGAEFGIYIKQDLCDVTGKVILGKDTCIATGITDNMGSLTFAGIPYVEYYIKELKAPDNFILNDGIVSISLKDFQYDESTGSYVNKQNIINKKQRFQLLIHKTGEDFVGYTPQSSEYGDYYIYEIGKTSLENVSFQLYNDQNKLVATQVTDKEGKAIFNNLLPGNYRLTETSAPFEYMLVDKSKDIVLKMDNREYNEFAPPTKEESFFNELCQCSIRLTKLGEHTFIQDSQLQFDQISLSNVVYGIYQNFDYTFLNNTQSLVKGSCVGYIVTNEAGEGIFNGKLPCGNYYIKELQTQSGYELDPNIYSFDIQPNNNQMIEVSVDDEPFVNKLSKASVQIIKTDSNTGKSIKGVEFTLYNDNKEQIGVYKTNKKGKILVENLPYGKYYFVETKCKDGYYSSNNKYYFELNSKETITLNITNSPILKLGINEGYKKALIVTAILSAILFGIMSISYYYARRSGNDE